jgi:hypothetical protein
MQTTRAKQETVYKATQILRREIAAVACIHEPRSEIPDVCAALLSTFLDGRGIVTRKQFLTAWLAVNAEDEP